VSKTKNPVRIPDQILGNPLSQAGRYMPSYRLQCHSAFSLTKTVKSHGWVQLEPWRWDGIYLSREDTIGPWQGSISVHQISETVLQIDTDFWVGSEVTALVKRWLSLDWDAGPFQALASEVDPAISEFLSAGGGRLLRGSCFYEDLVKTICTINTTWGQTKSMVSALVNLGEGRFPSPRLLLDIGFENVGQACKLGFRAQTLANATSRLMQEDKLTDDGSADEKQISYADLVAIKGIGPYSAAHCMVLLHDFSQLPIDSEVTAYLLESGIQPSSAEEHFSHWKDFPFLGYKLGRIVAKKNWIGD